MKHRRGKRSLVGTNKAKRNKMKLTRRILIGWEDLFFNRGMGIKGP